MVVRARAPLRLGLGGGGTDIEAYSQSFGGCVVNATIDFYAHCVVRHASSKAQLFSSDLGLRVSPLSEDAARLLPLHQAVYAHAVEHWNSGRDLFIELETNSDVPAGSGLGSSSALIVAQLAAYACFLGLSISKSDLAETAYYLERVKLGLSGGKQDQWASAYGGFNFFHFTNAGSVEAQPLLLDADFIGTLERHLMLFYTGLPRESGQVAEQHKQNVTSQEPATMQSLHLLKSDAMQLRESLQRGDLASLAHILQRSWAAKKYLAKGVSNDRLESVYAAAIQAGALAGKVAGAGGGGFMLFFIPPHKRKQIENALANFAGTTRNISFCNAGAEAWSLEPDKQWQLAQNTL